jgi:hypothetical protein
MRYLVQLRAGERATERAYDAWASGQEGAFLLHECLPASPRRLEQGEGCRLGEA